MHELDPAAAETALDERIDFIMRSVPAKAAVGLLCVVTDQLRRTIYRFLSWLWIVDFGQGIIESVDYHRRSMLFRLFNILSGTFEQRRHIQMLVELLHFFEGLGSLTLQQ